MVAKFTTRRFWISLLHLEDKNLDFEVKAILLD